MDPMGKIFTKTRIIDIWDPLFSGLIKVVATTVSPMVQVSSDGPNPGTTFH